MIAKNSSDLNIFRKLLVGQSLRPFSSPNVSSFDRLTQTYVREPQSCHYLDVEEGIILRCEAETKERLLLEQSLLQPSPY